MTKKTLAAVASLSMLCGIASAATVMDWQDLNKVHMHVVQCIHEMERASAANHYDMGGHAAKAEAHLREAEKELNEAVEDSKHAR